MTQFYNNNDRKRRRLMTRFNDDVDEIDFIKGHARRTIIMKAAVLDSKFGEAVATISAALASII